MGISHIIIAAILNNNTINLKGAKTKHWISHNRYYSTKRASTKTNSLAKILLWRREKQSGKIISSQPPFLNIITSISKSPPKKRKKLKKTKTKTKTTKRKHSIYQCLQSIHDDAFLAKILLSMVRKTDGQKNITIMIIKGADVLDHYNIDLLLKRRGK